MYGHPAPMLPAVTVPGSGRNASRVCVIEPFYLLYTLPAMSPHFPDVIPGFFFLPALFQVRDIVASQDEAPINVDAREFMASYAEDLRSGRRQAIVDRYDRRGAYRVGEGEKTLESWELIRAAYMTQWTPPATFGWRDLSYETVGPDAVLVIGLFDWGLADGRKISFSYTSLLLRQDGELRIRVESESMNPKMFATLNANRL